jgi:F-type H+-transporting ATPase subunit gamma
VGARAAAALEHAGRQIDQTLLVPGSADQITRTVQRMLVQLDAWQADAAVVRVRLFYNRHAGRKSYQPTDVDLLPVDLERFRGLAEKPWPSRSLPTFSMPRPVLLQRLVRQYLFVALFRACAESQASEHASRLAAMQAAQRNLDERLDEVTMTYRRARQNDITAELLDVVAGFEAITSGGG